MSLSAPWADYYLNNCFELSNFHYQNLSTKILFPLIIHIYLPIKPYQEYTPKRMSCLIIMFINEWPNFCTTSSIAEKNYKKQQEHLEMIALQPINQLIINVSINTGTIYTTLQKTAGEVNPYVCFVYIPKKNWNNIPRRSFRINERWSSKCKTNM